MDSDPGKCPKWISDHDAFYTQHGRVFEMPPTVVSSSKVGIAAFVLFAIVFRKRVRIWYVDESEDIVAKYAPWACKYITEWAEVQAVACTFQDGGLRLLDPSQHGHDLNHWVGGWPCDEGWASDQDYFMDAADMAMFMH